MSINKFDAVNTSSIQEADGASLSSLLKASGVNIEGALSLTIDTSLGDATSAFQLPIDTGTQNFTVFWGDGTSDTITVGSDPATDHTYSSGGVYQIDMFGTINGFNTNQISDRAKITGIPDMEAFIGQYLTGLTNLTSITTTAPDWALLAPTPNSLQDFFYNCTNFNADISAWDVSGVTGMRRMFRGTAFNQDISGWDVSSVGDMQDCFRGPSVFNQSINAWDVSSVTNFRFMFLANSVYDQPMNNWDTSSATTMREMFSGATAFNQDIGSWDTTGTDIERIFSGASSYNNGGVGGVGAGIDQWDVTGTTTFLRMFDTASSFDQYIGSWNVSGVQSMQEMFDRASVFNQDIGGWNVSGCTNFTNMFNRASAFDQDLGSWVFNASLTSLSGMFAVASSFTNGGVGGVGAGLDQWNVSNITNFSYMFPNCPFNEYIGSWDVSSGQTFTNFTEGAAATFDQNLSTWDLNSATSLSNAFPNMSDANAAACLVGWEANVPNTGVNATAVFGSRSLSQTTYASAKTAYDNLIASTGSGGYGWVITGITWV